MPPTAPDTRLLLPWGSIRTVLLDMDGTLLDRHFDDHFFLETVPAAYGQRHGLDPEAARQAVLAAYRQAEGTLAWYDLDYWSRELGLDIPLLKHEVAHLIQVHPAVLDFLDALGGAGRPAHLVTNAHAHSLALKMARTPIGAYLTSVTSCHTLGRPKEDPAFWPLLRDQLPFDPATTLLVDDSEPVLQAARAYGIGHLLHVAAPNSRLSPAYSTDFPSVHGFEGIDWPGPPGRGADTTRS